MKKVSLYAVMLLCSMYCFGSSDYKSTGIGLEIQNKAKRPLWVAILNGDKLAQPVQIKEKDESGLKKLVPTIHRASLEIDINQPTKLAVWYNDPGRVEYKPKFGGIVGKEVFNPAPKKLFTFTQGKTIYLTWDAADFPRPQTGKLGGLTGTTESGLSLNLNVSPSDIKEEPVN